MTGLFPLRPLQQSALDALKSSILAEGGQETDLTSERLKAAVHYDENTGIFTRISDPSARQCDISRRAGKEAGRTDSGGYKQISIAGKRYLAHRLAWLWMTGAFPSRQVDHINGVRDDNRWANLREATNPQNQANSKLERSTRSGLKGVHLRARCSAKPWIARIRINGKGRIVGYFSTKEAAHEAYVSELEKQFGEFARAK